MQTYVLEKINYSIVGRIYVNGKKTSAYVIPGKLNHYLFTQGQLRIINNKKF